MTHKYERTCWSCGSKDLARDSLGVLCSECGATWNECLELGPSELTRHHDEQQSILYGKRLASFSPSKSALQRAAKARAKARA